MISKRCTNKCRFKSKNFILVHYSLHSFFPPGLTDFYQLVIKQFHVPLFLFHYTFLVEKTSETKIKQNKHRVLDKKKKPLIKN